MMQDIVRQRRLRYPAIDESYYLSGSRDGELNAFEEYAVRRLTKDVLAGSLPSDLAFYMQEILHDSACVSHDA